MRSETRRKRGSLMRRLKGGSDAERVTENIYCICVNPNKRLCFLVGLKMHLSYLLRVG